MPFNLLQSFRPLLLKLHWLKKRIFSVPPHYHKFFWKISENLITNRLEYKPESFSFKFILRVIVYDSDTNFVHTFSLCSHAFLMKKSTASCFESSTGLGFLCTNILSSIYFLELEVTACISSTFYRDFCFH